ncbi:hypothetical protein MWU58_08015 [Flavobacteriaceae bacterium S0825]|uniref:oxidase n=1 Tax=Gaetbulibacter sp. S0825 TaxID=2720084 RepID=UPI0014302C31|nr:oxidase [Gaetbulibacter sp. S0825]MCK0109234.1 hypothetical protein [Flavobacteriaceae bacterium S0825]NIX64869.1 oxidase [Gaetbulibacter sp. S0825]
MNLFKEIKESLSAIELKQLKPIIKYIIFPAILFYFLSFVILKRSGFETMEIIRDTAQITNESSFLGFLSNIGIWLWVSSAAICFFAFFSRKDLKKNHRELLLLSGMLSLFLAIDDFFMIHDRYVNQYICYFFYIVFAALLLFRQRATILKINPLSFLLMGFFLMSSIGTDVIQLYLPFEYGTTQIFEEGFKFLGGAIWLYFNYSAGSYKETEIS